MTKCKGKIVFNDETIKLHKGGMVPVAVSLPAAQLPLPPRPHHRHPRAHVRRQGRREGEAGGRSQRVL